MVVPHCVCPVRNHSSADTEKYKPFTRVILSVVFLIFFIIILPTGESNEPASNNIANNTLSTLPASESPVTQEEDPEEEPEEKPEEQNQNTK